MNERLKEIRLKAELSQEEFGERIGIKSRGHVSGLEKGTKSITDRIVKDVCREFGYNEEWLRNGTPPQKISEKGKLSSYVAEITHGDDKFIKDLIEVYMELDPDSKKALRLIAEKMADKIKGRD